MGKVKDTLIQDIENVTSDEVIFKASEQINIDHSLVFEALAQTKTVAYSIEDLVEQMEEDLAMKLAAISVASISNTRESMDRNILDRDHPLYTCAYGDVVDTVNREMVLIDRVDQLTSALTEAREELNITLPIGHGDEPVYILDLIDDVLNKGV